MTRTLDREEASCLSVNASVWQVFGTIASDPKILFLNEGTAALDANSEKIFQEALASLQKAQPCTTLMVAHRWGTIKHCDKIAFLGGGGVLKWGSRLS